jgi:hypothetical protein
MVFIGAEKTWLCPQVLGLGGWLHPKPHMGKGGGYWCSHLLKKLAYPLSSPVHPLEDLPISNRNSLGLADPRGLCFEAAWANSLWDHISKKKKKSQKRADGVAQGVGPKFKPQYHKKKVWKASLFWFYWNTYSRFWALILYSLLPRPVLPTDFWDPRWSILAQEQS